MKIMTFAVIIASNCVNLLMPVLLLMHVNLAAFAKADSIAIKMEIVFQN
jgi:hypothetical protein